MTRMKVSKTWSLGLLLLISGLASAEEASVQWAKVTTLSSVVNGVVAELKVKPGQRVKKGQLLLRLQQDVFTSRLRAAESMSQARQDLSKEARAELQRTQEMYDNSMLSEHELEIKRLAAIMAEAEYKQSQTELAAARFEQQQSVVQAPFDALITNVHVAEYEAINSKLNPTPLIMLVSSNSISLQARLELSAAMKLSPGQRLKVKLAGKSRTATISRIQLELGDRGNSSSAKTALIELIVTVAPSSKIYPGQSATINFP